MTYEELRAKALQMQADAYRVYAEAEILNRNYLQPARDAERNRYLHLASMYDQMAETYRSMIPNAQEGNLQ